MRFVLDNSVAMRWLFGDGAADDLAYATMVLEAMERKQAEALVPSLWGLEAANVIQRAETKGLLSEARSTEFIGLIQHMAIAADTETFGHALADTLQLARRHKLSAYDAAYLELALREGLPLATLDADLRKAMAMTGAPLMQGP
jgi:predicted nucleic acid-binding protein